MINSIRKAYGAGWRAGMARPATVVINGHKYLAAPQCPYTGTWQFALRWIWFTGKDKGTVRRLNLWLAGRKGLYHG